MERRGRENSWPGGLGGLRLRRTLRPEPRASTKAVKSFFQTAKLLSFWGLGISKHLAVSHAANKSKRRMDGHHGKDVHSVSFSLRFFAVDHPDHEVDHLFPQVLEGPSFYQKTGIDIDIIHHSVVNP